MKGRVKFFKHICEERTKLWILFLLLLLGVVIITPAAFFVTRGTATYVVVILDLLGLGVMLLIVSGTLFACRQKFGA